MPDQATVSYAGQQRRADLVLALNESGGAALTSNDLRSDFGSSSTPTIGNSGNNEVLAANANRKGAQIVNTTGQVLYLRYHPTAAASATAYWTKLADGGEHTVDAGYKGRISGLTAAGSGNVSVTELI